MLNEVLKSRSLSSFLEGLGSGESYVLDQIEGAPKALLAALAAVKQGLSVLIITGGTREDRLFDDLAYLAPDLAIEFPSWETLPGEEIAPSPDIIGKRFEALYRLHLRPLTSGASPDAKADDGRRSVSPG